MRCLSFIPHSAVFVLLCLTTHGWTQSIDPQDEAILRQFNTEMQLAGWPAIWDENTPVDQWPGVYIDFSTKKVISLYIDGRELPSSAKNGSFPGCVEVLAQLTDLETFGLLFLNLEQLPTEIATLTQINFLDVRENRLVDLPEIRNMQNLTGLYLGSNSFTKTPDLSGLINLEDLYFTLNRQLTTVDPSLFQLSSLKRLDLGYCPFQTLPEGWGGLSNLERLDMDACTALRQLPGSIGQLKKLIRLEASFCAFTSLPESMGQMAALTDLFVNNNQLTSLPQSLNQLINLRQINFSHNKIVEFPVGIIGIVSLRFITAQHNQLQSIPTALWAGPKRELMVADFSHNHLNGPLLINNPRNIETLVINDNRLTFKDILHAYKDLRYWNRDITVVPQAKIGIHEKLIPQAGERVELEIDKYQPDPQARIRWYRARNTDHQNAVEVGQQEKLELPAFDPAVDGGFYYAVVSHPEIPNLELTSQDIIVIGDNRPPDLDLRDLKFRLGDDPLYLVGIVTDDYTLGQELVWEIGQAQHFDLQEEVQFGTLKRIRVIPRSPIWTGTEEVTISVKDTEGNATSRSASITAFPSVNQPPTIRPLPIIYLEPFDVIGATVYLSPFITDDIDEIGDLSINIDRDDVIAWQDRSVYLGTSKMSQVEHALFAVDGSGNLQAGEFTLEAEDTEGGITSRQVHFEVVTKNDPPSITAIPEQRIVVGGTAFPVLDLMAYVTDDHSSPEELGWILGETEDMEATLVDRKAYVRPKRLNETYQGSVTYYVWEYSNRSKVSEVKVVYTIAPASATTHAVTFRVMDGTAPVVNAMVEIAGGQYTTGSSGEVSVSGLVDGNYPYTVTADGYVASGGSVTVSGSNVEETISLAATTYSVIFRVTDGVSPIVNALVEVNGAQYITGSSGELSVSGLNKGSYLFSVVAPGYVTQSGSVAVSNRDLEEVIILTPVTYVVTFQVNNNMSPVANAIIEINGGQYTTNSSGEVIISGLVNGSYYYRVMADGFVAKNGNVAIAGGDVEEIVSLTPVTYTVTFHVSDGMSPVANVMIEINGDQYNTNSSGEVSVSGLVDGNYPYTVTAHGYAAGSGNVAISGGDVEETISLNPVTHTVTFRVSDGISPIIGAVVEINGGQYITGSTGEISISGLADGIYAYRVVAKGYVVQAGVVTVAGSDQLQEVVVVVTSVEDIGEDGSPFRVYPNPSKTGLFYLELQEEAAVSVFRLDGALVFHTRSPQGIQSLTLPRIGTYMVRVCISDQTVCASQLITYR